jgi:hypothetical protein
MKEAALHHPHFTDIPIWLRISDVAMKDMSTINMSNYWRTPANSKINWPMYYPELTQMLEDGIEPPEIARRLRLPRMAVSAKCEDLIESGKVVFGMKS